MTNISLPRIQTTSLSQQAYELMRTKIISKELSPGQRLNLNEIGTQLGISKTPLKEALKRLEAEGLINIAPRSGTFVTNPSSDEIEHSFDLRQVLELYAVERLAEQMTAETVQTLRGLVQALDCLITQNEVHDIYMDYLDLDHQFHRQLVALAGNPRLDAAHSRENIHAHMARIRYHSSLRSLSKPQQEHTQLVEALEARDAPQAKRILKAHLNRAKSWLLTDMMNGKGV